MENRLMKNILLLTLIFVLAQVATAQHDPQTRESKEPAKAKEVAKTQAPAKVINIIIDPQNYVDKEVKVYGAIFLNTSYFGAFREAELTHYSFLIQDYPSKQGDSLKVYGLRETTEIKVLKDILMILYPENKGKLGVFTIRFTSEQLSEFSVFRTAELIDYELVK